MTVRCCAMVFPVSLVAGLAMGLLPAATTWGKPPPGEVKRLAVAAAEESSPEDGPLARAREAVQRGRKLAARLRPKADASRLALLIAELDRLAARLAKLEAENDPAESAAQLDLEARGLVRRIAFCNPLLNFDKILFIKRHDAKGVFHMCDQFYGFNAVPGGGLFVLENPFGDSPRVVDLLKDSVVQSGRLQGRRLEGGSLLSPELSYEGRTIFFAYSEAHGKDLQWTPESCYHLFRVNADGSGLVQLTDGPWDDFDPCLLPGGRVAFISLRRGGYLRCGRCCPVYTLHSMRPDGGDILWLSRHETHEWQPSVTNDGLIAYTRWDYIDRDSDIAHHLWTCYPDGRDPRALHGNYPKRRESRPWIEMNIRAIPGSAKFVAVAAAHHGHAFGSLVLIDPRQVDDGAMSQLTRLTPDVLFPESEGRPIERYMAYGTPWPLSEDDYLCVYDPTTRTPHAPREASDRTRHAPRDAHPHAEREKYAEREEHVRPLNHGIYWIDRDGNRELLYRDPAIACLSPIPFRPRPQPPVVPAGTVQAAEDLARNGGQAPRATIAVMNVYDSDFSWPPRAKVAALRVVQVLPKTTAPPNQPRIGVAEQTNARAVLGTVPVEADGSAYFEAPVGREIYFQALDARGLAIQSMRSGAYVHPGERLTCQGCHERKHASPDPAAKRLEAKNPLALLRSPSMLQPDLPGSDPFSYVRLVQPALDRHCVACHQQRKALDLGGRIEGKLGFSRSYQSLAGKYGFYYEVYNGSIKAGAHGGSRSVPGKFGALASGLLKYLGPEHYGVKLPDEDFHRFTLWLDCNSEYYGSYEQTTTQARGEIVRPRLD